MSRCLEALNAGAKLSAARQIAGIASSTWGDWMAKGKDPANERHYEFRQAILTKRSKVMEHLTGIIVESAADDWKAAAWMLEKLYPKLFGKRATVQPVLRQDAGLSGDALRELRDSMMAGLLSAPKREDES